MSEEIKVVPLTEIQAKFDAYKKDVTEMMAQMRADNEKTGLALEQRQDDLQKALDFADTAAKRIEELDRMVKQNAFAASFGQSAGELKDALESFRAGFVEFNGDNEGIERPAGTKPSLKHLVEGVFQPDVEPDGPSNFHAPRHVAIKRLQAAADAVYAVDAMMRAQKGPGELEEYRQAGGARSLKVYKRFESLVGQFVKAAGDLIDTSTEVANWIPTQYSANLYEQVKIGLPILTLFPEVQMSAPTMILPLSLNDKEATRVTEATTITSGDPWSDTVFVNPSAISSNKITLSAEKLRSRFWVSEEAMEDALVAMLPYLNQMHRRNMGEAIEDAIINGQVSGLDTGGTHYSKTNPSAATDARDCWDGLRYFASTYTGSPATRADNSNGKPTVVGLRGLRAAMGEYGVSPSDLAYILGMYGYVQLLDDTNVLTIDKIGPNATIRTGIMGQVDGVDVLVSRRMPQNANASGIIDGVTTNRTLALVVHTMACIMGNRRRITLAQQRHESMDTTELVAFWRGDFQPVYPAATVPFVGELYNVKGA